MVERIWIRTVIAINRLHPKPIRSGIKNDIKWLLIGAHVHFREKLHIVPVIEVLRDHEWVVGDERCGTRKMLFIPSFLNF